MKVDPNFCMNSYLMYRTIVDHDCCFSPEWKPYFFHNEGTRTPVNNADELDAQLQEKMKLVQKNGPVALMLSSGMDSAILASYLPKGTQTYTLRCHANGAVDETEMAKYYAEKNQLKHTIIDVYWEDFIQYTIPLMKRKGHPIHSIEVQIYKAALQAKADGIKTLIFGETADIIYGGHSKLLARDWKLDEFIQRFSFVDVKKVLRHPNVIENPVAPFVQPDGNVDVFKFLNEFEYDVSLGFYNNACAMAQMNFFAPYSYTVLGHKLDLERIRKGEGKYVVRQLYRRLYHDVPVPDKTPLPRPMGEWLKNWNGPFHPEIIPKYISELTGDQKWYVYSLNQFMLELMEGESINAVPENGTH